MGGEQLLLDRWEMARSESGAIAGPVELAAASLDWIVADVPGTAAAALLQAGCWNEDGGVDFDGADWWFRTSFLADAPGAASLHLGGVATLADAWIDGQHVLHSENMFVAHDVPFVAAADGNELVVVCRSLRERLKRPRPRPRWKTRLVEHQQLRSIRTALLGRMPGWTPPAPPVGMWRPVEVRLSPGGLLTSARIVCALQDADGVVEYVGFVGGERPRHAKLAVGDVVATLHVEPLDGRWQLSGTLVVPDVARWFPATHGSPHLYAATVHYEIDGQRHRVPVGPLGFRVIAVDRSDDGFALSVNGVAIFCRGACWMPPDPIGLTASGDELRNALTQAARAGMNMVRVTGTTVYEQDEFFALCDELGILVWHDFMFANMQYPIDDHEFAASVAAEVEQFLGRIQRHPCVAVLCGGSEVEQQVAMLGVDEFANELGRAVLPEAVAAAAPGVAYVPCSPSGGVFPFSVGTGVSHYYGVGAYLRPLDDARRAAVRFTSECLAFSNVPCRESVEEMMRPGAPCGPASPWWKERVPRDRGVGWDFEDVRDHYVRAIFGVEPSTVRYSDPDRYLDLGRAATFEAVRATLSEWRRPGSTCAGALVYTLRDLWAGAGWGLVDGAGRAKSVWHAFATAAAPTAVLLSDEGLDGLLAHVVNDRAAPFIGALEVRLFGPDGEVLGVHECDVKVEGHGASVVSVDAAVGGFRDLTYAYRFGPLTYDVISVRLVDAGLTIVSEAFHLPNGHLRPRVDDVGLHALARHVGDDVELRVGCSRFAHFVSIELHGYEPDADWFHLAPHDERVVICRARRPVAIGRGEVRALNCARATAIRYP